MSSKFLTATWHHLIMANYQVEPKLLLDLVPRGTELDSWNGKHFVSVVGFHFLNTRVLGLPIPWHRNFEEVNLRFYVRRHVGNEVRRGVVFIREIVPKWAIAWVANTLYNERYSAMPMASSDRVLTGSSDSDCSDEVPREITYRWRTKLARTKTFRWNGISATTSGRPTVPAQNTEANFITEHYYGYVTQRDGSTMEYRVEHPSWNVWDVSSCVLDCDIETVYGREWVETVSGVPHSAFVAVGSDIVVRRGVRCC